MKSNTCKESGLAERLEFAKDLAIKAGNFAKDNQRRHGLQIMEKTLQEQFATSFLTGGSAAYLEEIYEQYLEDPSSVEDSWRNKFDDYINGTSEAKDIAHSQIQPVPPLTAGIPAANHAQCCFRARHAGC